MKKLCFLSALVASAVIYPMAANAAATSNGVVVARSGHLIAVASASGTVHTVRSSSRARVGARVRVSGSTVRVIGRSRSAHIHGVVVRRSSGRLLLAAGRSLVSMRAGSARRLSGLSGGGGPAPGTVVDTTTAITPAGQLAVTSMTGGGSVGSIQVQATVKSVGPGVIVLTVNGQPMEFKLPSGLTLPASLVGQTITLTLNLAGGDAVATPGDDDNDNDDGDENNKDDGDQNNNDNGDQNDNHDGGGGGGGDG